MRGIDHLVLATRDLDQQAELYRRLGFTVGARNRHPWGTLNHIVQFDRHFLELIAIEPGMAIPGPGEPVAQFVLPIARLLGRREGMTQLVLESRDAQADQADFAANGIAGRETFFFERRGQRPDGSNVHVAFTLAFAGSPSLPDCGFFVCQQHFPENFWNPAFQVHPNDVTGVAAVVLAAPGAEPADFLARFTGSARATAIPGGVRYETGRGLIEAVDAAAFEAAFGEPPPAAGPHFAGVRFACPNVAALADRLAAGGIRHRRHNGAAVVGAGDGHGLVLAFGG